MRSLMRRPKPTPMSTGDPIATALAAVITDAIEAACDEANDPLEEPWRYMEAEVAEARWRHIHHEEARGVVISLHEGGATGTASRIKHLIEVLENASSDLFWPVFLNTWPNCGGTWPYQPKLLEMLRHHAAQESAINYMHPGATAFFHALPPMVTAFRGCGRGHVLGLSWSMDQKIAKQFADPVLATARIRRSAVLAVCVGRLEFEIIVDPKYLRGIQLEAIKSHR
jgi:hypothetical protein